MENFVYTKSTPVYAQPGDRVVVYIIRPDMLKRVSFMPRWETRKFQNPNYGFKLKSYTKSDGTING